MENVITEILINSLGLFSNIGKYLLAMFLTIFLYQAKYKEIKDGIEKRLLTLEATLFFGILCYIFTNI